MRIKHSAWYYRFGLRLSSQLLKPRVFGLAGFNYPLSSMVHYCPMDGSMPMANQFALEGGKAFISHITALVGERGYPRRTSISAVRLIAEFKQRNKGFRVLKKDTDCLAQNKHCLVINYSMLDSLYRYNSNWQMEYNRFGNSWDSLIAGIIDCNKRFPLINQFLHIRIPSIIPKRSLFKAMEKGVTPSLLKVFDNPSILQLLSIWQALGGNKESFGSIGDYSRVNLVLQTGDHYCLINLGVIFGFGQGDNSGSGMSNTELQLRFWKLISLLSDYSRGECGIAEDSEGGVSLTPLTIPSTVEESDYAELPEGGFEYEGVDSPMEESEEGESEGIAEDSEGESEEIEAFVTEGDSVFLKAIDSIVTQSKLGTVGERKAKRVIAQIENSKTLKDPWGNKPLVEAMAYEDSDTLLESDQYSVRVSTTDSSLLHSKANKITTEYCRKLLRKDVVNSVIGLQKQGVSIKDWTMQRVENITSLHEEHSLTIEPVTGKQSTIKFQIPVIDHNGRFIKNGTTYRNKLQRVDLPIRKVNNSRVALSSYYNKLFIERSMRSVHNLEAWTAKQIRAIGLDNNDPRITALKLGNHFLPELKLPRTYAMLSKTISHFVSGEYVFYFDYANREKYFKNEYTGVPIALKGNKTITIQSDNCLYDGNQNLGTLYDIIGLGLNKAPVEIAEIALLQKPLPLGIMLAYYWGLSGLLERLKINHTRHERNERIVLQPDQYRIVFNDAVLVCDRNDTKASMLIGGFLRYHRSIKEYSIWEFDSKDVYSILLEDNGLTNRWIREMDCLQTAWVDPITENILKEMREPVVFEQLLIRAAELLTTEYSPLEMDPAYMRYRGYERIAGTIYQCISKAIRNQKAGYNPEAKKVELKPFEIYSKIVQDPSVFIVEEANPIANVKEQEGFTYRGDGGRSNVSMVERTRKVLAGDIGTVSEATVDSGDVGVLAYLSPDANITNLRGFTEARKETDGASKLLSTAALLAPCVEHDDMKRIGFVSIQHQQSIFTKGAEVSPLRTGGETLLAERTTESFATTAKQDGVVKEINKHAITVEYSDGSLSILPLGVQHGIAAGRVYPHPLTTALKAGERFKRGCTITYHEHYFTPDRYTPGMVSWKPGVLCTVAFMEKITTLEDGCEISSRIADKFITETTEVRNVIVNFEQNVRELVKEGDSVEVDSFLCVIEEAEVSGFGGASLDVLQRLSNKTPRAKVRGTVKKIECFYYGELEDMSESLQTIAKQSDRRLREKRKAMGQAVVTGKVDTSFRIKGESLNPNSLAIRIYIDYPVECATGDKLVVANQMKTIVSGVFSGENRLETGEPLDLKFANTSIEERIVLSPILISSTNALLRALSKHAAAVFKGNANVKYRTKS